MTRAELNQLTEGISEHQQQLQDNESKQQELQQDQQQINLQANNQLLMISGLVIFSVLVLTIVIFVFSQILRNRTKHDSGTNE